MKPNPLPETWQRLLQAAAALLEARNDHMVTAAEWDALHQVVAACGGTPQLEIGQGGSEPLTGIPAEGVHDWSHITSINPHLAGKHRLSHRSLGGPTLQCDGTN